MNRHRLKSLRNRYQSSLLGNFLYTRRSVNGRVVTIGPDNMKVSSVFYPVEGTTFGRTLVLPLVEPYS
jgi:hypothetical protein